MTLKHAFLGVMAAGVLAIGCTVDHDDGDPSGYYFTGKIYDGVQGKPVEKDITIALSQATDSEEIKVKKSAKGTFSIGPVKPGSDYVITIKAEGYRDFFAAEALKTALPTNTERQITQYYEAYLFPTDLLSPAVTFEIWGTDSMMARPNGKVRFAPAGEGTSALNLGGTMTPAVPNQMWNNDADRKAGTVILGISDGVVDVAEGALVYGVTYQATVYDVGGNGYESFNFTAGLTGHQTVILNDLADEQLQLTSSSLDTGAPSSDGTVTFKFNFPIEFSPIAPQNTVAELVDDGITIPTADFNGDGVANRLTATDSPNDRERGTSVEIDGNSLTLKWAGYNNPSSFEANSFDEGDLRSVTYALAGISLRRVGGTESDARTLVAILGRNSVTVNLK